VVAADARLSWRLRPASAREQARMSGHELMAEAAALGRSGFQQRREKFSF
jgi:hypothetical protein